MRSSVALAAVFLSSSPGDLRRPGGGGIKGEAFVTRSVMNTPLKAKPLLQPEGRKVHRKWRGTQENGSQRQARSRALGTAARRAPLQAAGLPGWVGKRERATPVRARRRQGWKPEGERPKGSLRSTTARPGRRAGDAHSIPPEPNAANVRDLLVLCAFR